MCAKRRSQLILSSLAAATDSPPMVNGHQGMAVQDEGQEAAAWQGRASLRAT